MITFSDDEHTLFDDNVRQVYVENSITLNNVSPDIFSMTFKRGLSVDVPPGVTSERTENWAALQISNKLNQLYREKSYKKHNPKAVNGE